MIVAAKIIKILLFAIVSLIFLPLVAVVHVAYGPWEKWFESIAKS